MESFSRLSRRAFLRRGAALAAAGFAAPYVVPFGVVAAEGRPGVECRVDRQCDVVKWICGAGLDVTR
jgi:hypothetical protein